MVRCITDIMREIHLRSYWSSDAEDNTFIWEESGKDLLRYLRYEYA